MSWTFGTNLGSVENPCGYHLGSPCPKVLWNSEKKKQGFTYKFLMIHWLFQPLFTYGLRLFLNVILSTLFFLNILKWPTDIHLLSFLLTSEPHFVLREPSVRLCVCVRTHAHMHACMFMCSYASAHFRGLCLVVETLTLEMAFSAHLDTHKLCAFGKVSFLGPL